jgi:CBS domain-containing protein
MEQGMTTFSAQKSPGSPATGRGRRRRRNGPTADDGQPARPPGRGRVSDEARGYHSSHGRGRARRPAGIITEADVAHAIAEGKDVNDVWVDAVTTTRPAVTTTTSIRDTATIMTARHFRHLPVTGDTSLLGGVDITDVGRALIGAEE